MFGCAMFFQYRSFYDSFGRGKSSCADFIVNQLLNFGSKRNYHFVLLYDDYTTKRERKSIVIYSVHFTGIRRTRSRYVPQQFRLTEIRRRASCAVADVRDSDHLIRLDNTKVDDIRIYRQRPCRVA